MSEASPSRIGICRSGSLPTSTVKSVAWTLERAGLAEVGYDKFVMLRRLRRRQEPCSISNTSGPTRGQTGLAFLRAAHVVQRSDRDLSERQPVRRSGTIHGTTSRRRLSSSVPSAPGGSSVSPAPPRSLLGAHMGQNRPWGAVQAQVADGCSARPPEVRRQGLRDVGEREADRGIRSKNASSSQRGLTRGVRGGSARASGDANSRSGYVAKSRASERRWDIA